MIEMREMGEGNRLKIEIDLSVGEIKVKEKKDLSGTKEIVVKRGVTKEIGVIEEIKATEEVTEDRDLANKTNTIKEGETLEVIKTVATRNVRINKDEKGQLDILVNNAYKGVNVIKINYIRMLFLSFI